MASAVEQTRSIRRQHIVYTTQDGLRVPGVTTVLNLRNKDLTNWAFNLGKNNPGLNSVRDHVDDLARIGSLIHGYADSKLKGTPLNTDDWSANEIKAADGACRKFDAWIADKKFTPLFSERPFVSEQYRFGGTIDLYGELDGKKALIDIKTSRAIYREMLYQVSAYALLLREAGHQVDEIRILRLGRVGSEGFEERAVTGWQLYEDAFLSLRSLYATEKEIDKAEAAGD